MTVNPLHVAAYAGKLAGIACEALFEALSGPVDTPPTVDDFDEAAAEKFLAEGGRLYNSPFAAASETSPGRDSAVEEGVPAPRDVPPARGAGHPGLAADIDAVLDVMTKWLHGELPNLTDDLDEYGRLGDRLRRYADHLGRLDDLLNRNR